jgi:hypothetical protein
MRNPPLLLLERGYFFFYELHCLAALGLETIPAVNGTSLARLEWNLCRLPTVIADDIEHLAGAAAARSHVAIAVAGAFTSSLRPA